MTPTIGTTGIFSIALPYSNLISTEQQLTVVSIRSLPELQASGEDPLGSIYTPAGEPESVFTADLAAQIPIVTLRTEGGDYLYLPANKLLSDAKLTGIKYVEKTLIVTLGYLPVDTNLDTMTTNLQTFVRDILGVTPVITPTDTSGVVHVSPIKHDTLSLVRTNKVTVDKSYETQYQELLVLYNAQAALLQNVDTVYRTNGIGA